MSGSYPIERREGEVERLRVQSDAMAEEAAVMLDRIGVSPGWRCLELGCGIGGITDLISPRVGPEGRVTGLDRDEVLLDVAREGARDRGHDNVEFVSGDAYATDLPGDAFDLVHARFLLSTSGQAEVLLAEMIRLARPGGVIAIQEPDVDTLECHPPSEAWSRLRQLLADGFDAVGADVHLAKRAYRMFLDQRIEDVQYRPFLIGVRSRDPMVDYLPQTIESLRGTLVETGLVESAELDDALARCRRHLADPGTVFTSYLVAQVWGRKPSG